LWFPQKATASAFIFRTEKSYTNNTNTTHDAFRSRTTKQLSGGQTPPSGHHSFLLIRQRTKKNEARNAKKSEERGKRNRRANAKMLRQLEAILSGVPTHRSGVEDPMEEDPRAPASSRHPSPSSSTSSSSSSASSGGPGLNNQENELERLKRLQEMETDKSSSSGSSLALNEADADAEDEDDDDVLLSTLPKELLVEIFGFCSVKDVCTARGVSRSWRRLIEHDALLWRRLGRQHLALYDIEEFMTPSELKLQADGPPDATNWVHIYQRVFGGGWDGAPPLHFIILFIIISVFHYLFLFFILFIMNIGFRIDF
jgi:hypothetical protein